MTEKSNAVRPWRKYGHRLISAIAGLLVIVCAGLVFGAFTPLIPGPIGYGSLALSLWPAWFIVLPLVSAGLIWRYSSGWFRIAFVILALFAVSGSTVILARVISVARANNVQLTFSNAFGFSSSLGVVKPDEVVAYTRDQGDNLTLRIFRPKGKAPDGGWPVLMHIHGGGWVEGSNSEQSADMRWFADKGWVVISVGYSLSNEERHLWDRVHSQIGCAMAWTEANIATRGGDARRLALRGGSAGGNISLNAAYMANAGTLRSSCGGRIPQVQSVMPVYPGVDLVEIYNNPYPGTAADLRSMAQRYTGGTPQQFPERYTAIASVTHLGPSAPPTLMFMSENDHLVPLASMQKFGAQVREAGIPLRTVSVPHAEHGFDLTGMGSEIVRQVSLQFMLKYDRKAVKR